MISNFPLQPVVFSTPAQKVSAKLQQFEIAAKSQSTPKASRRNVQVSRNHNLLQTFFRFCPEVKVLGKLSLSLSLSVVYVCEDIPLTHSLINHFETVPNSKKLQMKTEIWLLKDFKIYFT